MWSCTSRTAPQKNHFLRSLGRNMFFYHFNRWSPGGIHRIRSKTGWWDGKVDQWLNITTYSMILWKSVLKWTTVCQFFAILSMAEIPNNHLGCIKPLFIVGQTTKPQLVNRISAINSSICTIFISPHLNFAPGEVWLGGRCRWTQKSPT